MSNNGTKREVNELKPYYSEFVRHCLRYYIKTLGDGKGGHPIFRSDADRENWGACYHVLKDYSESDMDVIAYLYRPGDTIADKIYQMAKAKRVPQDTIWSLVNNTERKIAKRRGLL
jgi:hypothetical protein